MGWLWRCTGNLIDGDAGRSFNWRSGVGSGIRIHDQVAQFRYAGAAIGSGPQLGTDLFDVGGALAGDHVQNAVFSDLKAGANDRPRILQA